MKDRWNTRDDAFISRAIHAMKEGAENNGDIEINVQTGKYRPEGSDDEEWGDIDDNQYESVAPVFDPKPVLMTAGVSLFGGLLLGLVLVSIPLAVSSPAFGVGGVYVAAGQSVNWKA